MTPYYSAYGLLIRSEIDLPELVEANESTGEADVAIRRNEIEPVPESVEQHGRLRIQAEPDEYRLSYDSIGSFLVKNGTDISINPVASDIVSKKVFRRIIEKELMALLLHQRGLLVLHGSAVSIDGNAVIFLGQRGAGKSTTAAAFKARGHPVFDDDVVAIRFDDGKPVVVPGIPQLRLAPDAVDALGIEGTTRPEGDWGPEKRYRQFRQMPPPSRLSNVYVLQPGERVAIKEIPARNRVFVLITSTYTQGMLSDTGLASNHFKQCSTVVKTTAVRRLQRPKSHHVFREFIETVMADVC
jgi:hypothetical protein